MTSEKDHSTDNNPMTEYNLDPIFEFKMNEEETTAYKIGLLWIAITAKLFPDYRRVGGYPKRGDPRKSSLFRHCYTLRKKTKGIIEPKDYKHYILAQLQMLKAIQIGDLHPNIGPWCLIGDKAWTRWKVWKKKFENVEASQSVEKVGLDKAKLQDIINELIKTRKVIESKLGSYNEETFKFKAKEITRLLSLGLISGFYAAISPWFKKYCQLGDFDIKFYNDSVTHEVQEYFNKQYPEEIYKA